MKHFLGISFLAIVFFIAANTLATSEMHWGFKPSSNGEAVEMGDDIDNLLAKYDSFYKDTSGEKTLYLTFDNGYENGYTEQILKVLREENVPATFFLTGHYLTSATALVKQMVEDGHLIGNHSYGHSNMARMSESDLRAEWTKFDEKLNDLTNIKRTYYVRPPEGIYNERVLATAEKLGYTHVFWSVAFKDWDRYSTLPASYAYDALMKQLHPGAIILMHTVARHNAEAMPAFIKEAKKQGYVFRSLDDLVQTRALGY